MARADRSVYLAGSSGWLTVSEPRPRFYLPSACTGGPWAAAISRQGRGARRIHPTCGPDKLGRHLLSERARAELRLQHVPRQCHFGHRYLIRERARRSTSITGPGLKQGATTRASRHCNRFVISRLVLVAQPGRPDGYPQPSGGPGNANVFTQKHVLVGEICG
jgi:hypothetical protein